MPYPKYVYKHVIKSMYMVCAVLCFIVVDNMIFLASKSTWGCLHIKMPRYQYRKAHYIDSRFKIFYWPN